MIENRLLETAIAQFGLMGLEGTSTRAIAKAAGTAMSSITYHYGGKEGLYRAAAQYIGGQIAARMAPAMAAAPPADALLSFGEATDGMVSLLDSFVGMMLHKKSADWSRFIVREQMQPTEAFDILYDGCMGQMVATSARLVIAATGMTDRRAVDILVITLMGQALVFRAARATANRKLGGTLTDEATMSAVRARVAANARAILMAARAESGTDIRTDPGIY